MAQPHCFARQYYQKCTVPMANASDPKGFDSVAATFSWATTFIQRAADHFGQEYIQDRLEKWQWTLSTAFSGIGCAEQVGLHSKKVLEYSLPLLTETILSVVPCSLEPLHHRLRLPCRMLPSSFSVPVAEKSMWCCMMHVSAIHIVKRFCCLLMESLVDVCFQTS